MSVPPPPRPSGYSGASSDADENASAGFAAVALAHAGLAATVLLKPHAATEYLLGAVALPHNVTHEHQMGLLASGLLASASTAWALKGAADRHELETPTAERLQVGLMTMAATALGVHLYHARDLTNNGLGAGAATAALTFGVPAARLLATERGRRRLGSRLASIPDAARRLFTFPRGLKLTNVLYAALTPVFLGAGVAYVVNPGWTLGNLMGYALKGRDTTFLWRGVGGALLSVLPAVTFSLKEKADADQLAEPTPRALNLGLLLASAGHLAVLGPILNDGVGGRYLPALVGTWAVASLAALSGLASSGTDKRV